MGLLGMFGFRGFVRCYFLRDQKGKGYTKKTNIYSVLRKWHQLCCAGPLFPTSSVLVFIFNLYPGLGTPSTADVYFEYLYNLHPEREERKEVAW